jgi:hypothetical protein
VKTSVARIAEVLDQLALPTKDPAEHAGPGGRS